MFTLYIEDGYGLINYSYNKGIYNSVILVNTRDIDDFNKVLKSTLYYYYSQRKHRKENYLIFRYDDINPKLSDFELVRLSYPCMEVTLDGFFMNIRGNYKLGLKTIYKMPITSRLLSFKNFYERIDDMSKGELISYAKKNNFKINTYLKPHFMIRREVIECEKKAIRNICKN